MPPGNQNDGLGNWAYVIVVLLLIILVLLYPSILQWIPVILHPSVNVTGIVQVNGFTAVPDHVTFVGAGSPSTVAVNGNGLYLITLQNGHVYNITVEWSAAGGLASGNCTGGSLNLRSSNPVLNYNISC